MCERRDLLKSEILNAAHKETVRESTLMTRGSVPVAPAGTRFKWLEAGEETEGTFC